MSSLKDLASLIMIPSLYKDGRLDTVKPLGNSIIHPDATGNNDGTDGSTPAEGNFTFSRGSNLAATRVDVNGLIEKGRENVLTYSNNFNQWNIVSVSLTSGQEGYDGTNNAWLFNSSAGYIRNNLTLSGVYTFSIYAKKGTADGIRLRMDAGTDANVYISLTDGSESFSPSGIDYTATSVGGGWWRVSVTQNDSSFSNFRVYAIDASGASTTGTIYIQDAQVELGLVATDYIETGASTAQAGILEDMPRLDYSGGASCPSLLLEPQRTNLITQSEYFADSSYIDNGVSFTLGFLSPDGNLNASKLSEDNTNSIHRFYQTSLVTASPNATISVYVKYNGRRFVLMRIADSGVGRWYDIENGVLGGNFQGTPNDSTIESVGNDWYRITISHSVTSQARFELWVSDTESTSAYQGDVTKGVYLYGAQLELGSYPTSYIPTYGTSQTRSRDICEQLNMSSLFGNAGSTIYFETIYYPETNNGQGERWVYAQGNSSTDYIRLWQDLTGGTKRIRALVRTNDVQQVNITSTATALGLSDTEPSVIKFAFAFAENDFRMYVNGNVRTDTSGVVPPLVEMSFNNTFQTLFPLKQALVFPTALTDSECIALTTL